MGWGLSDKEAGWGGVGASIQKLLAYRLVLCYIIYMDESKARTSVMLPKDLHRRLRHACFDECLSLTRVVEVEMERWLAGRVKVRLGPKVTEEEKGGEGRKRVRP